MPEVLATSYNFKVDPTRNVHKVLVLFWLAGLSHPVICVDPSAEMLQIARSRDGLTPCLTTADNFLTTATNDLPKCKKILINESAHLFPDPQATFIKAHEYLSGSDGLLVVIVRATKSTFPMWRSLRDKFAPVSEDEFRVYLEKAGFNVRMSSEVSTIEMTKLDWYDRLRKRVFSTLYEFSDDQIEEGLAELDQEWFPGKVESDMVEIRDSLVFYIATP